MATLTVSEKLKLRVEAQASAEGFESVEAFIEKLVDANDLGGPPELSVGSDDELQAIVDRRLDGPWVEADAAEFARIKAKFREQVDRSAGNA
jgi:hypothetical protein